jgi:hypothetical protein
VGGVKVALGISTDVFEVRVIRGRMMESGMGIESGECEELRLDYKCGYVASLNIVLLEQPETLSKIGSTAD